MNQIYDFQTFYALDVVLYMTIIFVHNKKAEKILIIWNIASSSIFSSNNKKNISETYENMWKWQEKKSCEKRKIERTHACEG